MKKLGLLMRKTREIIGSILKKQMFIITKSVVGVADVYFDSQVFIIDLHSRKRVSDIRK